MLELRDLVIGCDPDRSGTVTYEEFFNSLNMKAIDSDDLVFGSSKKNDRIVLQQHMDRVEKKLRSFPAVQHWDPAQIDERDVARHLAGTPVGERSRGSPTHS